MDCERQKDAVTKGRGIWRRRGGRALAHSVTLSLLLLVTLLLPACSSPPGQLFDPSDTVHRWPPPPDQARIAYIGQLHSDVDLKPGRRSMQGLSEALWGKEPPREMLRPMAITTDGPRVFVADPDAH